MQQNKGEREWGEEGKKEEKKVTKTQLDHFS